MRAKHAGHAPHSSNHKDSQMLLRNIRESKRQRMVARSVGKCPPVPAGISNCSGNANLLKLPRGEVYDMVIVKPEKSWGHRTRFEDMTSAICHVFPIWRHLHPFTSYRNNRNCSTVIDFVNKDPTTNVYLVIICKETWYFSESKIIAVHCRGAKMSFPIFSDMLFWEACAKNVKY